MALSRNQKIYVAVLALAAAALAADRMLLAPSPEESVASTVAGPADNLTRPIRLVEESTRQARAPGSAGLSLAGRLYAMAEARKFDLSNVKNAFRTPKSWQAGSGKAGPVVVQDTIQLEKFRQGHRLVAVIVAAGGGSAIVDGKSYQVGQELDGFKLVSVTERSAIWVSGRHQVELTIPVEARPGAPE